ARNPEMVLQFAHHLSTVYEKRVDHPVEVRALVLLSLNGRKPQLLIDPNQDLAKVSRGQLDRPWVLPQSEPLRKEPWALPLMEWEKYVEIPQLEFIAKSPIVRPPVAVPRS
ncbi:MAG: HTTM domain-containing protein, partial [Planctomycetota bacterium]